MAGVEFGALSPMLCARANAPFDDPAYRFEPKLDGVRTLAYAVGGRVRLQTRRGHESTARYPDVVAAVAEALGGAPAVLDGEVCVADPQGVPDLAAVLRRESVRDPLRAERAAREQPATLFVFDILWRGGRSLLEAPLEARRDALLDALAPVDGVAPVRFLQGSGRGAFEAATAVGFEGVVAKRRGSRYRPGRRSEDWLKVKHEAEADLVVGGWFPGKGALSGTVGALAVGAYDDAGALRYVGRVGSGIPRRERHALHRALPLLHVEASPFAGGGPEGAVFVEPVLVVSVRFQAVTARGVLRAPVFTGARTDKPVRECRLEDLARLRR